MNDIVSVSEHPLVEIRNSSIHGTGAFARQDLAAGERVIEYVGEKISKEEANCRCEADNRYIFYLDEQFDIDGSVAWNPARFLNHSCAPNCEAVNEDDGIWIVAVRDIKVGDELTFNYGYDLDAYRDYPCRCGAVDCLGFIVAEEFFPTVRSQLALRGSESPAS
jgi:SET domain-containing protein